MADVLSRRRCSRTRGSRARSIGGLAGLLLVLLGPTLVLGQDTPTRPRPADADEPKAKAKAADAEQDDAPAPDLPEAQPADPAQSGKVAPVEVFRDPAATALMDISKLKPLDPVAFTPNEVLQVKEMAANPNVTINRALVERVVRGLAANLTDKKSIQSLLEEPDPDPAKAPPAKKGAVPKKKTDTDGGKAIQAATADLLEPIYRARASGNDAFLTTYRRVLGQYLPPLLKNHLVPRVQAMIVLGQAGGPESLTLFQNEIASRSQVLWVKLWALEGIANIKQGGGRFSADEESRVARVVSDFLKQKELPWLIQLRGLEALGALRQAALPSRASEAPMANTAMSFLADSDARMEVRSEAARALGLMNGASVPRYNFRLVAYGIGHLAADVAEQFNEVFSDKPPRILNRPKAQYLAALLAGPVYQVLEGIPGKNNSGLLQTASNDQDSSKYVRKVMDLVKQVTQFSISLLNSPPSQYKARKEALSKQIAALRKYLEDNPPPSRRLVDKGPQFNFGAPAAGAWRLRAEQPVADNRRGR